MNARWDDNWKDSRGASRSTPVESHKSNENLSAGAETNSATSFGSLSRLRKRESSLAKSAESKPAADEQTETVAVSENLKSKAVRQAPGRVRVVIYSILVVALCAAVVITAVVAIMAAIQNGDRNQVNEATRSVVLAQTEHWDQNGKYSENIYSLGVPLYDQHVLTTSSLNVNGGTVAFTYELRGSQVDVVMKDGAVISVDCQDMGGKCPDDLIGK